MDARKNLAYSLVATAPSPASSGTTLSVTAGQGALFPAAPFNVVVWPANTQPVTTNAEIVRVTSKGSGDDWTITRTQESTSARSIIVGDQVAAMVTDRMITDIVNLLASHPQAGMINGQIVSSVSSNNLTVAIKTLAGTDPSATDPVYVRIGNTVRAITAALSVTKNAGTNWCNAGSAELATKDIDYFVYLGYNATDGVVIGFSRINWAETYADFSTTSTNEFYAAISTITNAQSSDAYVNIGRFNAILSAGAGYTWSISGSVIINRPCHSTRWLDYTLAASCSGSMTISGGTKGLQRYQMNNRVMTVQACYTAFTLGGSASTDIYFTLPFSSVRSASNIANSSFVCRLVDHGTAGLGWMGIKDSTPGSAVIRKSAETNWGLGTTDSYFMATLIMEV